MQCGDGSELLVATCSGVNSMDKRLMTAFLRWDCVKLAQMTQRAKMSRCVKFRTLAPMQSCDNMRAVAEGIEAMGRGEAAYWLGMAMHRKHPRRV